MNEIMIRPLALQLFRAASAVPTSYYYTREAGTA
jgi:hypothetical protein